MKSEKGKPNFQVGRRLICWFIDGDYTEVIQIEYRYALDSEDNPRSKMRDSEYSLYTKIRDSEYRINDYRFFLAIGQLLDDLPKSSAIKIVHPVIVSRRGSDYVAELEEWVSPYEIRDTGTVVYKLGLSLGEKYIETRQHLDFANAAEELRQQLGPDCHIKICFFCHFLMPFNDWGGTDYRHDQLYCLRDTPETLDEVVGSYPKLAEHIPSLEKGLQNVDALHSCSAFRYRSTPRY